MGETENSDSADTSASNQTLPLDATDTMIITENTVSDQYICEDSEESVTVLSTTTTSAAQAEYFALLMSRALPGTAGPRVA